MDVTKCWSLILFALVVQYTPLYVTGHFSVQFESRNLFLLSSRTYFLCGKVIPVLKSLSNRLGLSRSHALTCVVRRRNCLLTFFGKLPPAQTASCSILLSVGPRVPIQATAVIPHPAGRESACLELQFTPPPSRTEPNYLFRSVSRCVCS
jgi:hypothetical protein